MLDKEKKLAAIQSDVADRTSDDPDKYTNAETTDLEKRANKPALRAEAAHDALILDLNNRNRILQQKLDRRENEVFSLLPEVAELRQARRTARIGDFMVLAAISLGGGLISAASHEDYAHASQYLISSGWALLVVGLVLMFVQNCFSWPKQREEVHPKN